MSAVNCPECSRTQGHQEHCCPASASAELKAAHALIAEMANEIRGLKNECDVLEELRREVMQAAEDQGVYL